MEFASKYTVEMYFTTLYSKSPVRFNYIISYVRYIPVQQFIFGDQISETSRFPSLSVTTPLINIITKKKQKNT